MRAGARRVLISILTTLAIGCGGGATSESTTTVETGTTETTTGAESAAWLEGIPEGGRLTYEVTRSGQEAQRVEMEVQLLTRRGDATAVRLAPIGTPLGDEPVFPQWVIGGDGLLAGLDQTASLTTEAGYVPIDDGGRLQTEAADNVAWRVPADWLTPGRVVAGEEVSAGWQLAERIGDRAEPVAARGCVRLERAEGGARAALVVCASVGLLESSRSAADGTVEEQWTLVSIAGPRTSTDEASAETH